jgi:predicted SnoaL-like aldol condensation-catalyzing enzyme
MHLPSLPGLLDRVDRARTERARPPSVHRAEQPVAGGAETACTTDHIRCERGNLVSKHWLAPMALALLCAGSGWNTTASAQEADALNNKLVFAVVVNQIFNQGKLALVGDFMAKDVTSNGVPLGRDGFKALVKDIRTTAPDLKLTVDDVATQGDRVIGHVTQTGGGASERRIILLRIDHGLVPEHWSWPAQPGVPRPFDGLEGTRLPAIPAAPEIPSVIPSGALTNLPRLEPSLSDLRVAAAQQPAASAS